MQDEEDMQRDCLFEKIEDDKYLVEPHNKKRERESN